MQTKINNIYNIYNINIIYIIIFRHTSKSLIVRLFVCSDVRMFGCSDFIFCLFLNKVDSILPL